LKCEDIRKIVVVGAGMMGSQIAQLFAEKGYSVSLVDVSDERVQLGINSIKDRLDKFFVKKGKITQEQADAILAKIKGTTNLEEACKDVDFVVEAVFEDLNLKKDVFKRLDQATPKHTILASNTSSLSITEMAKVTSKPDKVVGTHFFNPVAVMRLVEVVKGLTSDETVNVTMELMKKLGKTPILCKDSPGFVANRVYAGLIQEALWCVYTGVASPKDVDTALKLGYNLPMGPLELMDYTGGWDIALTMSKLYMEEFGPRYAPCPLLFELVRAGYLGKKVGTAGKGIYDYYEEHMKK